MRSCTCHWSLRLQFPCLWGDYSRGGLNLGVAGVSSTLILILMLSLLAFRQMSLLSLGVPRRQVQKLSHSLFFVAPGPTGLDLVAVVTHFVPLQRNILLSLP